MYYLGIDIGSLFVGAVLIDSEGKVVKTDYERHRGEPLDTTKKILASYPDRKSVV